MNFAPLCRMGAAALCALTLGTALSAGPKVGVLLKGRSPFWDAMQKGAQDTGARLGADVIVKAPLAETDIAVQVQLLSVLVAQKIQVLVIAPTSNDVLAGPVAALAAKGIKVVVIDSQMKGGTVFVGTNQKAAGEAAGTFLAGLVGDGDEVSFFRHNQNSGATVEREVSAMEKLRATHPKIPIHADVFASTEPGMEGERAEFLLEKYPGTKAILAGGTPGTIAMLRVLAARNQPGKIKFIGFGFNLNKTVAGAIAKGTMDGWVAQRPADIGAKGVEEAVALVNGETVAPVNYVDFTIVSKANLQDADVQSLMMGP
jgi:ribose transport system substrate-binding protein